MSLTTTLSLGKLRRREQYLMKDGFVFWYILILFTDNLLKFFNLFALPNDAGPFKWRLSSFRTSSIDIPVFSTRLFRCLLFTFIDSRLCVFSFGSDGLPSCSFFCFLLWLSWCTFLFIFTVKLIYKFTLDFGMLWQVNFFVGCCKLYKKLLTSPPWANC